VNTLEGRGMVRRVRSDVDRRLVTIELTRAGMQLVAQAQAAAHEYERALVSSMSKHEQRQLARLLDVLRESARDMTKHQNTGT
jgi:DNA-binding MarR family transcriptional regulator